VSTAHPWPFRFIQEYFMKFTQIIGALLIVAGVAGLAFGRFSYTRQSEAAKIGPLALNVTEKQEVNVPPWISLAAICGGAALLVLSRKK
jgi:hypothetical protein